MKTLNINIVQNFGHIQNKSIIYRPGIYNLQTRTLTFPEQEKLLEKLNLRYLKMLKTKKLNTKNPQIKYFSWLKYVMMYICIPKKIIQIMQIEFLINSNTKSSQI